MSQEVLVAEEAARIARAEAALDAGLATVATAPAQPIEQVPEAAGQQAAEPEPQPEREAAQVEREDSNVHALRETFDLGEFSYQFTAFRARRSVGNTLTRIRAQDGATFVVIEYRERNNGQRPYEGMGSVVRTLTDAEGRRYTPDEQATAAVYFAGGDIEIAGQTQLMPGIWNARQVVFQLPADSTRAEVDLRVVGRGLVFTAPTAIVRGRAR